MLDNNGNGKVDTVTVSFSETLASYTAGNAPWTLANVPSSGSLSSVSVTTNTATLTITEGAGAADTAVGSFTVALATNANGIRDAAGNQSSFAAASPSDGATPVRTAMTMLDNNANGKVDQVTVVFSETLAASTATPQWTLANVPSTGALASVATATNTATLTITEGGGAASTAVGSFTVALATSATGIRDAAGNQSSFGATAPSDGAGPVPITLVDTDGGTNGKFETGDTMTVTFSEPVSIPLTSSNVVLTEGNGSQNDTLNIPGLFSTFDTGADGYLQSGNNQNATFTGSTISQPTSSSVRVTLAACNAGASTTCSMGTESTGGTFTATPVSGIQDAAGNGAAGSIQKTTFRIF
jgi:hypothetical protein